MRIAKLLLTAVCSAALLAACSTGPKLASEPMPRSGFLPSYDVLRPVASPSADARIWRYRKAGVNPGTYTAVILEPVHLNRGAYSKDVTPEAVASAVAALQQSMREAVESRSDVRLVTQPGPGVVRIAVGITGAEASADGLKPWNFTPIGLATNSAAYVAGVNAKTPALLVESRMTDSQTNEFIGGGLITVQGESFRTGSGSLEAFTNMAKKVVRVAMEASANPGPTH